MSNEQKMKLSLTFNNVVSLLGAVLAAYVALQLHAISLERSLALADLQKETAATYVSRQWFTTELSLLHDADSSTAAQEKVDQLRNNEQLGKINETLQALRTVVAVIDNNVQQLKQHDNK